MQSEKSTYSILYIEDEFAIRKNYVTYLNRYYSKVFDSSSAEEGYLIYKNEKPDIMIVDINLKAMSGLELIRKIRNDDLQTKIIVLTANSSSDFLLEASDLKLTKYLIKPISRQSLTDSLEIAKREIQKFDISSTDLIYLSDNYHWSKKINELYHNDMIVKLTKKERSILTLLFDNINLKLSYKVILEEVWDDYEYTKIDSLKTAMKQIRRKLPEDMIQNIYGFGYSIKA